MPISYFIVLIMVCQLTSATKLINALDNEGRTPVVTAVIYNDNVAILNILLEHGVDCEIRDIHGKSAIDYAIEYYKLDAFKILLAYGCHLGDIALEDKQKFADQTSVFHSIKTCDIEMLRKSIYGSQISPNVADVNGCTLLFWAIDSCSEAIPVLLDLGASANKRIPLACCTNCHL